MKRYFIIFLLFSLLFTSCGTTQDIAKQSGVPEQKIPRITLEDIWRDYSFLPRRMHALRPMGDQMYSVMERTPAGEVELNLYKFEDMRKAETVLVSSELGFVPDDYTFSKNGNKILLSSESEPIYRHSERSYYYVFDRQTKKVQKLFDRKIQSPAFSPAEQKVAFVFENNIYVKDLHSGKLDQITYDGKINSVINGLTDWVYEEEFGFVRAYRWNADGTALAYLRFDESEVPEFSMSIFGDRLYPSVERFKYPKAGEKNSKVELYIYDIKSGNSQKVDLPPYEYIPRILWTKDPGRLSVQTLNRKQNDFNLYIVNRETGKYQKVYSEQSGTYINIRDILTFLDDGSFIISNETSGYEHLYHYDRDGKLIAPVTKGNWEVTDFYGYDSATNRVFYQSTEDGSMYRTLYSIRIDGTDKKRISPARGISSPVFSGDKRFLILNYNDADTPPEYDLYHSEGAKIKKIRDNAGLLKKLEAYRLPPKTYSTLHTKTGDFNMWMIKPRDFDPDKLYPLLMYQYSGPGVQTVMDRWKGFDDYWYYMLADEGYIVASVDGRGTGGRGAEFTHCTYGQLGKYETIDQIEAAKTLGALPYIDSGRIGIWGWSFGGFTTANALFKGNDVFKMGIAVAPVTNWRYYDTVYTERYMGLPDENPSGYDDNSPIHFVSRLKGKFLLIHGSGDDNVHVQNSMRLINAMIEADVPFDSEIYPDRTHGIYRGKNTRLHLYQKMTRYILDNL